MVHGKKKKEKNFKTQPFNHKQIKWQEFLREKNIWFTVVLKKRGIFYKVEKTGIIVKLYEDMHELLKSWFN